MVCRIGKATKCKFYSGGGNHGTEDLLDIQADLVAVNVSVILSGKLFKVYINIFHFESRDNLV